MKTVNVSCISIDAWKLLKENGYSIVWVETAGKITLIDAQDILAFEKMIG